MSLVPTRARFALAAILVLVATAALPLAAQSGPEEARLLRYPDIHGDFVVFVYAGDVWRAPSAGGTAYRLTSHEGVELTPQISPDGAWVAYSAEYTGSRQVYVVPAAGGPPRQLTYANDVGQLPPRGGFDNWVLGWSPDGRVLVRMNRTPWGDRPGRYFLVHPDGGLEAPLPLPVGGSAGLSPDGRSIAYTPNAREFRTWKRYRGGWNQDLWTFDLDAARSRRLTSDPGNENFPMWVGDTVYYLSDAGPKANLWARPAAGGEGRQLTAFDEFDVLWPSLGPGAIVFMNGGWLYRFDLASEAAERIPIAIGSDLPLTVARFRDVSGNIAAASVAPGGERALFEARGELFTVPAKHGPTRNLTASQGVREMSPAWSPDGRWIAYLSDESGEFELYVRPQDGSAPPRQLTRESEVWRYPPLWSPDGARLAFGDSDQRLWVLEVASGETTLVDTGTETSLDTYVWSPDSRWLAYETTHETELPAIALYSLESGRRSILGEGLTFDFNPAFSADGKHLFFLSNRDYQLTFSDFEFNYVYNRSTRVYAAALDPDAPPLFPPRSDEVEDEEEEEDVMEEKDEDAGGEAGDGKGRDGDKKKEEKKKAEKKAPPPPVLVEVEGFTTRTVALPDLAPGDYGSVVAVEGGVLYLRFAQDGEGALQRYDLEERKEEEVAAGVAEYVVAAGGEKVLYRSGDKWFLGDAKPGGKAEALDLAGLRVKLDPRAEWRQMFEEAWRIGRDWFYDPGMHGMDWAALRERYGQLVPHVAHRGDLDFVLGELVSELEAGHAYVQAGDQPEVERVEGGLLGAELEPDPSGRYRIARIFSGENWDPAYRSPLTEPGVGVTEGELLLSIDGVELTTSDHPYRLLEGKGDQVVTLRVGREPTVAGSREVKVRTITREGNLRYLDWVKGRMALVERLSGGRIGYIHLPDTAQGGNRMLQKLFYSQVSKPALIVDERYNGGGFIPDRMIEMLSRTTMSYWARRGLEAFRTPGFAHDGPKAMLINGYAGSGGDALPYYFRQAGLGPLIGTRTWGGLIGISGNPQLADGGGVLYPTFRFYEREGAWAVEGIGVAPDIEVIDLPERLLEGGDPSVEKAVEVLLEALEGYEGEPATPEPPDLSGDD